MLKIFFNPQLKETCPNCGHDCLETDILCPHCGKNIDKLFEQLPDAEISAPPLFGGVINISIKVFLIFQSMVLLFFTYSSFMPSNGVANVFIGTPVICAEGVFFIFSIGLYIVKSSQDSKGAITPFLIFVATWLLVFFVSFIVSKLDLRFRFFQRDFEESARIALTIQGNEYRLPKEYQHLSATSSAFIVQGRVFYMESIGMMSEPGPGYLFDPSDRPDAVCYEVSRVPFVPHWYRCSYLDWALVW